MQANVFQTLSDPTRLRLVEVLRAGERPVNELVAAVDIHQSGVSRHLRILEEAGFVTVRPVGQQRLYALKPEPFRELDQWLGAYRQMWEARLDRFAVALKQKQARRAN